VADAPDAAVFLFAVFFRTVVVRAVVVRAAFLGAVFLRGTVVREVALRATVRRALVFEAAFVRRVGPVAVAAGRFLFVVEARVAAGRRGVAAPPDLAVRPDVDRADFDRLPEVFGRLPELAAGLPARGRRGAAALRLAIVDILSRA
jgi:hypothetical protein